MRWLDRLIGTMLRLFGLGGRVIPREPVSLRPIGVVRNNAFEPRTDGWERVRSDLIFRDDLLDALDGIESYSHIMVIFACHQVAGGAHTTLRDRFWGDPRLPEQGVLATRSQRRPNAIGVSVVPLVRRRRNILRVIGLDAIDGTPVLDIKPYLPSYDSVPDATVPDWALEPPSETTGDDPAQ